MEGSGYDKWLHGNLLFLTTDEKCRIDGVGQMALRKFSAQWMKWDSFNSLNGKWAIFHCRNG
jgi:hypothetical protein